MKKIIFIAIFTLMLAALFSCNGETGAIVSYDPITDPATEEDPSDGTGDGIDGEPPVDNDEPPPPVFIDPTGGLPRGADNILAGSAVLDEPVLLMGMGVDPVVVINVRDGPSLEAGRLTTIGRGEVVEAFEIVDGWYSVTVFASMTEGYIRSDLLVPYVMPDIDDEFPEDEESSNVFTGADPSGLARGADGILIGSVDFNEPIFLMGMSSNPLAIINVRKGPSIDAFRVNSEWGTVTIGKGQKVEAFGVEDGWYRVRVHPGMFEGYIRSDLLVPYDETRQYYADSISNFDTKMSRDEELISESTLVDLRTVAPDIVYSLIFATPDNYTGNTQYSRDVPLLQAGTAEKLRQAQELFKQDGYSIKLYDAYRPSSVSGRLYNLIRDARYVAKAGTSIHNRAAAVDITLVDATGTELEMPSPMMTLDSSSHRDSKAMSDEARANMNYMTEIMKQVGMSNVISTEWWHFGDSESSKYLPIDIEFRDIPFSVAR